MDRTAYLKLIEEISLNAWPSYKTELYDGWLIRFSHNYTFRTNSVVQIGASSLPVPDKIAYCESLYANYRTPANFKITPLLEPSFDALLAERGYEMCNKAEVMTAPLTALPPLNTVVQLEHSITDEWLAALFRLNGIADPVLVQIVPSMFRAIPKEIIVASIKVDGSIVASGLGILERGHVGLYAIYVAAGYRRQSFARAICTSILSEAQKQGMTHAYLQVATGNIAAKNLYQSLGFQDFYTYWFRSKQRT